MQTAPKPAFRTFEDLEAYQVAREFRKQIYAVSRRLPDIEKYDLGSQMRRAAVSLTSNIAEGHGRHHFLDQLRFLLQARGSLEELLDDLNICLDEGYLPAAEVSNYKELGWRVHRIINGYGRYLRQRKADASSVIHESPVPYQTDDESDPFADQAI